MLKRYIVELCVDSPHVKDKSHASQEFAKTVVFDGTLRHLKDFLDQHEGAFLGWYQQDGEEFIGTALIDLPEEFPPILETCPFIELLAIPGYQRVVFEAEGFIIHPHSEKIGGTCPEPA